jgi:hypothetical protein
MLRLIADRAHEHGSGGHRPPLQPAFECVTRKSCRFLVDELTESSILRIPRKRTDSRMGLGVLPAPSRADLGQIIGEGRILSCTGGGRVDL